MGIQEARQRLEHDVGALVGQRLIGVAYYEIEYPDGEPAWNADPSFDSLDFGLELRFESGEACWITWGGDFYQYALKVDLNTQQHRSLMREWDVSLASRWREVVGVEISRAQVYWDSQSTWTATTAVVRRWGPQDLELTFEGGTVVFISALEKRPGHDPFRQTDNLTVFFDDTVAQRYLVGPFTTAPHTAPAGASAGGLIG